MSTDLVRAAPVSIPAIDRGQEMPALVERAGPAAAFVWEEYFMARHTNRHTQRAYLLAVCRFLAWAEGRGVELPQITPGMVGEYISGMGGSASRSKASFLNFAFLNFAGL